MYLREAAKRLLLQVDQPVVTEYEFFLLINKLLIAGNLDGELVQRRFDDWDVQRVRTLLSALRRDRVLVADDDFRSGVWRVVQASSNVTAEEACCLADPFCYVSHLSAMHRYNLTERAPIELHITTPDRTRWNELRAKKMDEDLGSISPRLEVPALNRVGFKKRVRKREVAVHETRHPATPRSVRGERSRIAPIGHVFVEMLEDPALCGGIRHVIDVWEAHASTWADDIIAAVDRHTSKIVRVRAGYLFDEVVGINDRRVETWVRDAQRGGSRKLNPDAPYAPQFSEKWMLSINVD